MTVRLKDDPASTAPAGCRALVVWGPRAEVGRWLETTDGVEWVGRPQPLGADVLVRVGVRREALAPKATQVRRTAAVPWYRERDKVIVAGLAAGVVLAAIGLAVWLLVGLVIAVVAWIAANWPLLVAILIVAALALLLLRKTFGSGSGCAGLHCAGCRNHR